MEQLGRLKPSTIFDQLLCNLREILINNMYCPQQIAEPLLLNHLKYFAERKLLTMDFKPSVSVLFGHYSLPGPRILTKLGRTKIEKTT